MHLNLLSRSSRLEQMLRSSLRTLTISLVAGAAALGANIVLRLPSVWESDSIATEAATAIAPMRDLADDTVRLRADLAALQSLVQEVGHLRPNSESLAVLALIGRAVAGTNGAVQVSAIRWTNVKNDRADAVIGLQGIAGDDNEVAAFVDQLRAAQAGLHVELKGCTRERSGDVERRRFDLSCRFR